MRTWPPPVIWATPTEPSSSAPRTRMVSLWWGMGSTPAFGRGKKTADGRSCWIWGMIARRPMGRRSLTESARSSFGWKDSLPKVAQNRVRLGVCHDCRQRRRICLLDGLDAPKMLQQAAGGAGADARDLEQFAGAVAHLAALAVESHGEAVSFVADQLHQVQDRRVVVERDGFVFLSVHVDEFLALGNRDQRLVDDLQ